ncbi:hypothetical protein ACWDTG_04190 [Rhodococcus zopfii]|uniref:Integral membrane protein n=1 Tax=Rhodococcus zopfii TaxID=43772 RepID=A0ABU3WRE6_9NOCA|nr:hypothetical protein [Rhodococcus zopfii]MDV2476317.1 hypothetical protein [Rhodococcus zopfii]
MNAWGRRGGGPYDENYDDEYYDDEYYQSEYYGDNYYASEYSDAPTEVFDRAGRRRDNVVVRAVRALSGLVCGAVVVLAIVVGIAQYLSGNRGVPGPGAESVGAHAVAAIVVIAAQLSADRRRGPAVLLGSAVVFVTAVFLMFTQWWG